ncbi:MAG: FtsX-like permease family protein [Vicinamibacterales bacterium]
MDWFRHDLKQALRLLARRPGFSALAILALAVGLGVNTVAFSAVNALLYKPFRFAGAESAGWLFVGTSRDTLAESSVPTFETIATGARTLAAVAAEGRVPLAWSHDGQTDEIWSLVVSADYFSIVQVSPTAGRTLGPGDGTRGDLPVLVSERFWRRHLDARADLGAIPLGLNGQSAAIVGVLPDDYQGPGGLYEPDVWVPLDARRTVSLPEPYEDADRGWLTLIGRPAPGVTAEAIRSELAALTADPTLASQGVERRVRYERFVDRHPEARGLATVAGIGLLAVGAVLLIACFNVAGLMLARALERRRDLSVRAALGASRWRLARSLLTEGLVFATIGGAAALLLAAWSASLLSAFSLPAPIPQRLHFVTDWRLVAFSAVAALVAALVPALAPMWQLARTDLARWSRLGGTAGAGAFGQRRARRGFVLLQIAGSTLFLATALVTVNAFRDAWSIDAGFDADRTAVLTLDPAQYDVTPADALMLVAQMADRLRATPGVEAVGLTDRPPFAVGITPAHRISADGRDCASGGCETAGVIRADAGYFRTTARGPVAGDVPDAGPWRDRPDDVAAVNEAAAARLWPGQSPIGRSFKDDTEGRWREVVAVLPDATVAFGRAATPQLYLPLSAADGAGGLGIIARGASDATALLAPMREAARAVAPTVPVQAVQTLAERVALPLWLPRTTISFFGLCALLAVALSTVGLFGVTYYAVNQRRREFGVRSALGASTRDVGRMIVAETLRLAAPGVLLGVLAAILVVVINRAALSGLDAPGPLPFVAAVAIQFAVTAAAAWSPARRAARANPLEVLRAE